MERDVEQPDPERPESLEPDHEPTDRPLPDDVADGPDAAATPEQLVPHDESNLFNVDVPSSVAAEADSGDEDSVLQPQPEPSEDDAASDIDLPTSGPSNVTRIELPTDNAISSFAPSPPPRDPQDYALPLERPDASEDEPTPAEQIFPREWRLPGDSVQPPESPSVDTTQPADPGQPMPRVQVLVMLAEPYAAVEEVAAQAAERMAPKFQQLAGQEVWYADWVRQCEARAADYRLRGPG